MFGKIFNFAATYVCFHPVYGKSWLAAFDLKHDPRPIIDLNFSEMKSALFSTPTKIRQISLNKMPAVLSKDHFNSLEEYKEIGFEEILKRAKIVKENQDFCNKVFEILAEKAKEKQDTSSQTNESVSNTTEKNGDPAQNTTSMESNEKTNITPLGLRLFLQQSINFFTLYKSNKWIVCFTKIKSNFFLL